jgi:WD40 repeat protein
MSEPPCLPISAVAISPDGQRVAAATGDQGLSIVPIRRPRAGVEPFLKLAPESARFKVSRPIAALCYPGDETLYAAKTSGAFARFSLGESASPTLKFEISDAHGVGGELTGIAAVSESSVITTCGKDSLVRCWDPETRQSIARLAGHKYEVRAVAAAESEISSGDSDVVNIIASAGRDKTVRLWDVRSSESNPIHVFSGHTGWVHDVAISGGGCRSVVVSCAGDKSVRVWDLGMMRQAQVFTGHEYRVWGVAVASDGGFAISGSTDTTVRAWDLTRDADAPGISITFEGHRDSVICVDVSRDGAAAVSGCEDGSLYVWDTSALFRRDVVSEQRVKERASSSVSAVVVEQPVSENLPLNVVSGEDSVPACSDDVNETPIDLLTATSLLDEDVNLERNNVPTVTAAVTRPSFSQSDVTTLPSFVASTKEAATDDESVATSELLPPEKPTAVDVNPTDSTQERKPTASSDAARIQQLECELEATKRLAMVASARVEYTPAEAGDSFAEAPRDPNTKLLPPSIASINERLRGVARRLDVLVAQETY